MKAWHFLPPDRRLRYGSGELVEVGKTIKVSGEPKLCRHGLHASVRLIDALCYAPGPILCRVEIGGKIKRGDDKIVGTERIVLAMADATDTLRRFARMCALDVAHLWGAPSVFVQYLRTGDGDLRGAALDAALDAARAADRDAVWSAVERAAWRAAWGAAWSAAWSTAHGAAWGTAHGAARDVARDAAFGAARNKQARRLAAMVSALLRTENRTSGEEG